MIKNEQEILELLQAIWDTTKLAIGHCPGYQKGTGPIQTGNNLIDQTAREVAFTLRVTPALVDPGARTLPQNPQYTMAELPMTHIVEDWWRTADG